MEIHKINLVDYQQALAIYEELKADFPKCFFPLGNEKPLKVGIYKDLMKLEKYRIQQPSLKTFFKIYTSSVFYRACLIFPWATRIDLEGNKVSEIFPKGRFIAKTYSVQILFELDKEGYEHKRSLAFKLKKLGTSNPQEIHDLFKTPKQEKIKPAKKVKPVTVPKAKEPSLQASQKNSKPSKAKEQKKPAVIVVKKKKKIIPDS